VTDDLVLDPDRLVVHGFYAGFLHVFTPLLGASRPAGFVQALLPPLADCLVWVPVGCGLLYVASCDRGSVVFAGSSFVALGATAPARPSGHLTPFLWLCGS
jgi:hypothetical protein